MYPGLVLKMRVESGIDKVREPRENPSRGLLDWKFGDSERMEEMTERKGATPMRLCMES